MTPLEIRRQLIKYGILGPILAYALWQNWHLTEKLFSVIENNTNALQQLKSESCADTCREAFK